MFQLNSIEEAFKSSSDEFTIVRDGELKGNIYYTENSKLASKSFGNCPVMKKSDFESFYIKNKDKYSNHYFTVGYEGPHVKVWWDETGEVHFSNDNKVDCKNSFFGNKEKTFWKLFNENGGEKFIEKLPSDVKKLGNTHHFMIVDRELLITTRVDMRDNETIVVYLGTTTLDGKILDVIFIDKEIYFSNNEDRANVFPEKSVLGGRILLPTKITAQEAFNLLTNGYENPLSQIPEFTKGENVIFRDGIDGIVKFVADNYELRSFIAGRTPNVKNQLYILLENAKNDMEYDDKFPIFGCLNESNLETIKSNQKIHTTFIVSKFLENSKNFNKDLVDDRYSNILTVCILSCPLTKVNLFIDGWNDYIKCRDKILNFIRAHNNDIRMDKYDDRLIEFHQKALLRIKDLAKVSKIYASDKSRGHTYHSRMVYSLKGLLKNEFNTSLYRIEKAVSFIQGNP